MTTGVLKDLWEMVTGDSDTASHNCAKQEARKLVEVLSTVEGLRVEKKREAEPDDPD